jgi:hypothetical protein
MADEKAKEEVETSEETSEKETPKQQSSEQEESASEGEKTPSEPDRGDLRVALKEERTKRQTLENQLKDPMFVYQTAKELGLTESEAQAASETTSDQEIQQPQPPQPNFYGVAEEVFDYKKAVENFPQVESDPDIRDMVNGMVQAGKKPAEAVKIVQKRFEKAAELAQKETDQEKKAEAEVQKGASTAPVSSNVSFEDEEMAELQEKSKDLDPAIAKKAQIEILKKINKRDKII